jgi:hypothetical protein
MEKNGRTKATWLTAGLAVVIACLVIPTLVASANAASPMATSAGANPASQSWAYGGEAWQNGTVILSNAEYTYSAFYGWTVIYTATPTTANISALEAQRTLGATLSVDYCAPNCSSPVTTATLSVKGNEQDTGFANVTNQATVYENGSAVAAVGILNGSSSSQSSLTESAQVTHNGHTASQSFSVAGSSSASISFSPALGLVPLSLSDSNNTWNSSAAFTASGAWNYTYAWSATNFAGATTGGTGNSSGAVNRSGDVSLTGYVIGIVHLRTGLVTPAILLVVQGPFDLYAGFILVPHAYGLFGGAPHVFNADAVGTASFGASRLDGQIVNNQFRPAAESATVGAAGSLGTSIAATTGSPSDSYGSPGATIQAQPMSVAQAQQENNQLINGPSGSGGSAMSLLLPAVVIGVVVAAIVGAVAVTEWRIYSRRQKQNPPQLVGGYSESMSGVPPTGMSTLPPTGSSGGSAPSGPQEQSPRQL